ncbi:hypothetical protein L1987_44465 [Smallanthus sonchifolius]|uniref:Uncharacterized protein n=1 Tax=Smallanthus sonchifolius TaxID=185202 RepID=A0ACB9GNY6_9ASTR|nr:hypothetical protein L1987_44465 [Smallanthus sonchifolius]
MFKPHKPTAINESQEFSGKRTILKEWNGITSQQKISIKNLLKFLMKFRNQTKKTCLGMVIDLFHVSFPNQSETSFPIETVVFPGPAVSRILPLIYNQAPIGSIYLNYRRKNN